MDDGLVVVKIRVRISANDSYPPAERVTAGGGRGVAVRVDHTVKEEIAALVERLRRDEGRLDVLVNDIWGGDARTEWGGTFWELSADKGLAMQKTAVHTHILTSRHAVPLMLESAPGGLVVEITDGDAYSYRGNLFYDLVKRPASSGSPSSWPRSCADAG